jgi:hypothetical protein
MDIFELFFEHFDEAKRQVLEGKVDLNLLSERGSNLFHYACFFGDKELMSYCYDKVDIHLLNEEGSNGLVVSLDNLEAFKNTLQFYQEKNLSTEINLTQGMKEISFEDKNTFNYFLDYFSYSKEDVLKVIIENPYINRVKQFLGYYFDYYQEEPYGFILKKIKEEKIYPFFTTVQEPIEEINQFYYQCLEEITEYNQENFKKLYDKVQSFSFSKETQKKIRHILPDSSKEFFTIYNIKKMKFEDPLSLFDIHYEKNIDLNLMKQLKEIQEKYHFRNIVVHAEIFSKPEMITRLINSIEKVKEVFGLTDEEVGHDSLDIYFKNILEYMTNGYYSPKGHFIVLDMHFKENVFLHEYTHAQQFLSKKQDGLIQKNFDNKLNVLIGNMSSFKTSKEDVVNYIMDGIKNRLNDTSNIKRLIELAIDFKNSYNDMKKAFEDEIKKNMLTHHDFIPIRFNLKNKLDSYKKNQSLEIEYFKKLDNIHKIDKRDVYWAEDVEIHARLNEIVNYPQKIHNNGEFNSNMVNYIKPQLKEFNLLLADNMRLIKKQNKLPKKNSLIN